MTETEYINMVDQMGRVMQQGKRGATSDMRPILERIGVKPDEWVDTVCSYESRFYQAVGTEPSLQLCRPDRQPLGPRHQIGPQIVQILSFRPDNQRLPKIMDIHYLSAKRSLVASTIRQIRGCPEFGKWVIVRNSNWWMSSII